MMEIAGRTLPRERRSMPQSLGRPAALFLLVLVPAGSVSGELGGVRLPLLEVALLFAIPFLAAWLASRGAFAVDLTTACVLAFVSAVAIGAVQSTNGAGIHRLLFWSGAALLCLGVRELASGSGRSLVVWVLAGVGVFEAVVALGQFLAARNDRATSFDGAVVSERPEGTLNHPNALALLLLLVLFPLVGMIVCSEGPTRIVTAAASACLVAGIGVSFSRAGWAALVAGTLVLLLDPRAPRRIGVLCVTSFLLVAPWVALDGGSFLDRLSSFFSTRTLDPNGFRLGVWSDALHSIVGHPLAGNHAFVVVHEFAGATTEATNAHNLVLGLAVALGIPATLAFAGLMFACARNAWRARAAVDDTVGSLAIGCIASMAALIVFGIADYGLWSESVALVVFALFGLAAGLPRDGHSLERSP